MPARCKTLTTLTYPKAAATVLPCRASRFGQSKSDHKAERAENGKRQGCMTTNRFALLTAETSGDSVDSPNNASPADSLDTTTLSAALTNARQAPVPMTATPA